MRQACIHATGLCQLFDYRSNTPETLQDVHTTDTCSLELCGQLMWLLANETNFLLLANMLTCYDNILPALPTSGTA